MTSELLDAIQGFSMLVLLAALGGLVALWEYSGGRTRLAAWRLRQRAAADVLRLRAERLARTVMAAEARRSQVDRTVEARERTFTLRREVAEAEAGWLAIDPEAAKAAGVDRLRMVGR